MNIESRIKSRIHKGDTVQLLLGKDRGKEGKVLKIDTKDSSALIDGLNMVKRHVRSMQGVEGGIISLPKSVDLSNIMLVCPNCKKPTRVSLKVEGSEKQRVCKKCQKPIDSKGDKK